MHVEIFRQLLLKKPLKELYQLRGDMYKSKEEIVQDIIDYDDGSVAEMVEVETSDLAFLAGKQK